MHFHVLSPTGELLAEVSTPDDSTESRRVAWEMARSEFGDGVRLVEVEYRESER